MSGRLIDRNRGAKIIPGAYPYAHLQLIVQPLAGGQDGRIGIGSPDLSLRPFQRRAADLNRGCAAMIANRHIFVIGEQRIVGPTQPPNIFGVANAGVENGIIAYLRRQVESAVRSLVKGWPDRRTEERRGGE